MPDSLQDLTAAICKFADDRDWERFHSPKNLAMALIVEAAELVEHFQWLSRKQSGELDDEQRRAVSLEMADVLIYLVRMAEQLDIDLLEAAGKKMALNAEKYPADRSRSRADKYTRYPKPARDL
ncbi:MAG: nucleotide pyrophosphohydrolase [Deltaproteobacteria bacterium]|nr:nucleotide pyrophosphohydrolase [Deltaproteobacteria bacterium]